LLLSIFELKTKRRERQRYSMEPEAFQEMTETVDNEAELPQSFPTCEEFENKFQRSHSLDLLSQKNKTARSSGLERSVKKKEDSFSR
jgi:hypothetical protein